MNLLNLKAIPIAHEGNVYSINQKELNVIKKIKYRPPKEGHYLSETISLLENKTLASLKKFIIESDGQPRGFTSNQFYTFILSPVDS